MALELFYPVLSTTPTCFRLPRASVILSAPVPSPRIEKKFSCTNENEKGFRSVSLKFRNFAIFLGCNYNSRIKCLICVFDQWLLDIRLVFVRREKWYKLCDFFFFHFRMTRCLKRKRYSLFSHAQTWVREVINPPIINVVCNFFFFFSINLLPFEFSLLSKYHFHILKKKKKERDTRDNILNFFFFKSKKWFLYLQFV